MGYIYKITTPESKLYIGSTQNFELRKIYHLEALRSNTHINNYLQEAYNKWGEDVLIFSILEETDSLLKSEDAWIRGTDSRLLYNIDLDILNTTIIKTNAGSRFKPTKSIVNILTKKRIFGVDYIKDLTMRTRIPHKVFLSTLAKLVNSGYFKKENDLWIRMKK